MQPVEHVHRFLTLIISLFENTVFHSGCKAGIQSGANENQDDRGQKDDRVVVNHTEDARTAGQHESAQGINDVGQRI
jgi:hypothetical protein